MTLWATMMVRNEDDILGWTIAHLLNEGVDGILVADNLSTDETPDILQAFAEVDNVVIVQDEVVGYDQSEKMTSLAHQAAELGADWVLPCDADEWFYWTDGTLAEFVERCTVDVVTASGWDHLVTLEDDPVDANPYTRIRHRRVEPQKFGKVMFRYHPDVVVDFGNHFVEHPGIKARGLNYRHYQYRSLEQFKAKVRHGAKAANLADLPPMYAAHWRADAELDDRAIEERWNVLCREPGLIVDPAP